MLRSYLVTAPLIILATVVMGSLSVAGSLVDRSGRFQHACARRWSNFILRVSGIRCSVDGLDHVSPSGKYVICANHQSQMDIPVLLATFPFPFRFAAKKELFRIPFLGWHLSRAGHFPIDRAHPLAAARSLERSVETVRAGLPVVIFPEGGTSRDGRIRAFKRGAFIVSQESGAEVIPVSIRGTRATLTPGSKRVRPGSVSVTILDPISSNLLSAAELAGKTRDTIAGNFNVTTT